MVALRTATFHAPAWDEVEQIEINAAQHAAANDEGTSSHGEAQAIYGLVCALPLSLLLWALIAAPFL